ncbi:MAG: Yip1 family protein [Candidatus Eisenbacteria bacterium]
MAEVKESRDAGAPTPRDPESARSGIRGWITGVFMDPSGTFSSIAESLERPHPTDPSKTKDTSKWWLPVIITIVVGIGIALYTVPTFIAPVQADAVREAVMERGGTEADVEQAMSISGAMMVPMSLIGVVVVTFILVFAAAGAVHLLMKMLGGKGKFRHARAIVAWSMLITTLGSLVKLPMMIAKKNMVVETGPSLFFKNLEPSDRLFKFLSSFDIFTIWWMVVLAVAMAVVYRVSRGKSWVAVAILWIVIILISTFTPGGMGAGM